ncbi:ScyD/ScyE family protein [Luteitalea sp.]|uniref:ScyD/ScyE family protein n=1 Tax=Luteitalea sp. TaxID=2004800 RepID=UPI0025BC37B9|nr:ScyD/ScyE family protein [Luteitalea sp.]
MVVSMSRWVMAGVFVVAGSIAAASAQTPVVMAQGLDNPRGMAFGPDGAIYVAEAGRGGTSTLCLAVPTGPGQRCYGPTGAVTRVLTGTPLRQGRVLGGLPSLAVQSGAEAAGPHDIDFGFGAAFITVGSGGDPATLQPFRQAGIPFGNLLLVNYTGQITPIVDVAAHETAANPDGGLLDSNLYSLEITNTRGLVTDAGANALLQIAPNLSISTLAVFPARTVAGPGGNVQMQSVPTAVVEALDGSIYVGELTGFPFPVGGANVYRIPAGGGTPTVVATGFTNIIDIALGPDGAAYVLEHDTNSLLTAGNIGRLVKIGPFGFQTELAAGQLVDPGALLIGADNAVYVSVNSKSAGTGQVVRITQ